MAKKKDVEAKSKKGKASKEETKSKKSKAAKEETKSKKAKKVAEDADSDEAEQEGGKKSKKAKKDSTAVFDYGSIYTEDLDAIARRQGVEVSSLDIGDPMSTGLLMYDLLLGGGIRAGMYTEAGWEQSAKTTKALNTMAAFLKAGIPLIEWWDYEGSTKNSKKYVNAIVRGMGVKLGKDELFGKKDDATGKWLVRPRVRYHAETVGDKFFDYMSEVLRKLPDKKFIAKKWWLRFDETKENKAKYGEHGDASMPKKYGKGIWIPAPDGKLQGVFFTDSYPAMNPAANDEEDANNGLGLQARMFSKHLPRVKGRLAEKMVALIGINQMRDVPMAMFGPKEQEPGGKALRFNSDVRSRNTARASGMPLWPKNFNDAREEVEKSAEFDDSKDRYRYIETKMIKNKLWTPGRRGWFRIWIEDGEGTARGFCPFFDTMIYLRETGQLKGKGRDKLELHLQGTSLNDEKVQKIKGLSWFDFKQWVLGDKEKMIKMSKKAGVKPMSIRSYCFQQLASGKGEALYVENKEDSSDEE